MLARISPFLLAALFATAAYAEPAPFDLSGPTLEATVTRSGKTLPISAVPELAVGDRIWLKADLPSTQSARYLLVAAFLRGSTNPPPANWFFRCETWKRSCSQDGLTVRVPQDAQQVLVFLAPATNGDFKTLMNAARGRPGAFVRASQDLNQAALDRSRLESYLAAVRKLDDADVSRLKAATPLLARSLAIKVDPKCLDRIPQLQAACLMQDQSSLILDDGHSTSIVEALTSGPASDLAMEASYSPQLSYGYYSPYIASVLDIARIMSSFTTAQYQYIPALASQNGDRLQLTLNTPPSFHDPKSVLVAALPAVEPPQLPPLHAVNPKDTYCARKDSLVLPVEGAPLVFSTGYAHDLTLSLSGKDGKTIDLPARADAEEGGFVIDTAGLRSAALGDSVHGSLRGYWGFEKFSGPGFELENAHAQSWSIASGDDALIVGREETIHLEAASVSCIDGIMLKDPDGKALRAEWKPVKANEVEVKVPLQQASPGALTLLVGQYGAHEPQPVALHAFAEAGHLDSFSIHAGDISGLLKGTRLDEVAQLSLNHADFFPGNLTTSGAGDELTMLAQDSPAATSLKAGENAKAKATLKDGRVLSVKVSIDPARPRVALIGKDIETAAASAASNIHLAGHDELPQGAKLTFSLHAQIPSTFTRDEQIEVATTDETFSTTLSLHNGGLTLENSRVAIATLDPAAAFGSSAFGALRFRVMADGVAGDWVPLATLVRLPVLKELKCPTTQELACKLSGTNLFLVDSISNHPQFEHSVQVPDGFPGNALPVPHPTDGQLYVKLRDDPSVVSEAALGAEQLPQSGPTASSATASGASPPAAASNLPHAASDAPASMAAPVGSSKPGPAAAAPSGSPAASTAPESPAAATPPGAPPASTPTSSTAPTPTSAPEAAPATAIHTTDSRTLPNTM